MTDWWLTANDQSKMNGVVLVDFKKAFDSVDHKIILNKLNFYGTKDTSLMWFNSYLTNRQQQVSINTCSTKSNF